MPRKYNSTSFPVERVRELYDYDYETGHLISKSKMKAGKPVIGSLNNSKSAFVIYLCRKDGTIVKTNYARVVFCWHHGRWPEGSIDHIDRDFRNNRIENLRDADPALQSQNQGNYNYGARWIQSRNKWVARINPNGKLKHLGTFETQKEAQERYMAACDEIGRQYLKPVLVNDRYVPAERLDSSAVYIPISPRDF